ncbi:hypothetical protein ACFC09_32110 [Streptomyces sp. NPDC056161]|uniref:hypothetical protein n=1 Tax=Streptomyces sp. NPDC056161 TaxID=3345732 RepID=UPI0035D5AD66
MATNVEATAAKIERLRVGEISPGLAQLALTLAWDCNILDEAMILGDDAGRADAHHVRR